MVRLVSQKFGRFPLLIILLIYKIWICNYGKSEIIHKDIIMMYWCNIEDHDNSAVGLSFNIKWFVLGLMFLLLVTILRTFDVRQLLCIHKYKKVRLQHLNLMAIVEKTILITGRYVFAPFIQLLFCLFGFVFKFPI